MKFTKYILIVAPLLIAATCTNEKIDKGSKELNPYNPEPKMEALKEAKGDNITNMHFLVFGDSKGSMHFPNVLKRADSLKPDFCITTADLVNKGAGNQGITDYKLLDSMGGWFMRKYPMWPTVGNHEEAGGDNGIENFTDFYGMEKAMYSFEYGNAKFIALPWPKISKDPVKLQWLEDELKSAQGKHIFIYKHRPHYTVGKKSYNDVEGKATATTKLYDKYHVKAVFSGHDHLYYRTKRNGTYHIISAGAGATIYKLKREQDVLEGDVYYGKRIDAETADGIAPYKFVAADGAVTDIAENMFYVLSVRIDNEVVSIEMIDEKTGKVWDKAILD